MGCDSLTLIQHPASWHIAPSRLQLIRNVCTLLERVIAATCGLFELNNQVNAAPRSLANTENPNHQREVSLSSLPCLEGVGFSI